MAKKKKTNAIITNTVTIQVNGEWVQYKEGDEVWLTREQKEGLKGRYTDK